MRFEKLFGFGRFVRFGSELETRERLPDGKRGLPSSHNIHCRGRRTLGARSEFRPASALRAATAESSTTTRGRHRRGRATPGMLIETLADFAHGELFIIFATSLSLHSM